MWETTDTKGAAHRLCRSTGLPKPDVAGLRDVPLAFLVKNGALTLSGREVELERTKVCLPRELYWRLGGGKGEEGRGWGGGGGERRAGDHPSSERP